MSRVFGYARVSTAEQTTSNQIAEIRAAGFDIDPKRMVVETISGSSAIDQRKGFVKLMERMEDGDCLVVTKLDRLGRNSIDVQQTVGRLADLGVRVVCLALGGVDLTSSAGKMTMGVIAAVAQFERDLLIERTLSGQSRAKAAGVKFGRPPALANGERAKVIEQLAAGISISSVARASGVSRATVLRARQAATRVSG
jgi:putative DNA-invertase from lambdoid prophage Rac